MFEARMAQGSLLKKIMEAIGALVPEVNIEVSSSGMVVQAMDTSHVCLVALELESDGFEPFRCDKNIILGVAIKSLLKVLRCADNDDSITLRAKDDSDCLEVFIENTDQDKTSNFEVKLMDIDAERLGIPETEYSAMVKMPATEFQRIARDISQFGDSMVISCTKEGVQFSTALSSVTDGSAKITLKQGAAMDKKSEGVAVELREPVSLTYACHYIGFFVKATPLSDGVSLSLKAGQPLVCEYRIGTVGHLKYYLAPKIEDSEES